MFWNAGGRTHCAWRWGQRELGRRGRKGRIASGVKPGGPRFLWIPELHFACFPTPGRRSRAGRSHSQRALCSPCLLLRLKASFPSSSTCFWNLSCFRTPPEPSLEDGGRWAAVDVAHGYQAGPRSTACSGRCRDTPASLCPECSRFFPEACCGRGPCGSRCPSRLLLDVTVTGGPSRFPASTCVQGASAGL